MNQHMYRSGGWTRIKGHKSVCIQIEYSPLCWLIVFLTSWTRVHISSTSSAIPTKVDNDQISAAVMSCQVIGPHHFLVCCHFLFIYNHTHYKINNCSSMRSELALNAFDIPLFQSCMYVKLISSLELMSFCSRSSLPTSTTIWTKCTYTSYFIWRLYWYVIVYHLFW